MNLPDFKNLWETFSGQWIQIMIHPIDFFETLNENEPSREQAVVFAVICGVLAGLIKTVLTFGKQFYTILTYPLLFIIIAGAGGAVIFIFFKLSGGEGKFEPTLKMMGYTHAISIFSFGIPTVGPLIGLYQIWLLAVVGITAHELHIRSALLAVVIPIFIYMVLMTLIATILGVNFFGGIISHEGQVY
jgi:hypothetical protein